MIWKFTVSFLKNILEWKIRKKTEPSLSADAFIPFMVCQADLCSLLFVYDTLRYNIIFFTMNLERKRNVSLPQSLLLHFSQSQKNSKISVRSTSWVGKLVRHELAKFYCNLILKAYFLVICKITLSCKCI